MQLQKEVNYRKFSNIEYKETILKLNTIKFCSTHIISYKPIK